MGIHPQCLFLNSQLTYVMIPSPLRWLGLLLGTRLYYSFYDAVSDDDAAFEKRMDALCREIGARGQGQQKPREAVPPTSARVSRPSTPALAPAPDAVPVSSKARAIAAPAIPAPAPSPTSSPTPTLAPTPAPHLTSTAPEQQLVSSFNAAASTGLAEVVSLMREEREAAKADWIEMETKLERQRVEMQAKIEELTKPQEAISTAQVSDLTTRLGRLRSQQILKDDELCAVEDCIADFLEATGGFGVVSIELVNAHQAVGKAHKLILLSEGLVDDAMFVRQIRRRFC